MKLTIQTFVAASLLLASSVWASSAWASTPTFSGHVAYKNFESCSNGVYTGAGAYGGVACQNGKWGTQAARFDGVDDGVSLADKPAFHMTDAMTVSAWVRPDTTAGQGTLVAKWYTMDSYRLAVDDGQYRFIVAFPGGTWGTKVAAEAPATAGAWTHVAGVYDGASVALYINGELADATPASGTLQPSNRPLTIGNHPSWAAYDGVLDEVRLYDQALTPLQVKELASMIHHRFSASPSVSRDLDVTHIERAPRIDYDAVPNVPQNGDSVTWKAHIRNRGTQTLTNFKYIFYYDGNWKKTGTISSLAPGATTTVSYTRSWQSDDHYLGFVVDYQNAYSEKSERNNYRLIRTNALMVGLWVEQSVRDYFDQNQYAFQQTHGIDDEANSWEDWAQRQMDKWNEMLANARTISTPRAASTACAWTR